VVIITSDQPYSQQEIIKLQEVFGSYIKTVIDIEQEICSAGMDHHYEGEEILLKQGSQQSDVWGGGIDVGSKLIDFNSFINIRPQDNNPSNDILDQEVRKCYEQLTRHFFQEIYD
jgi:hypothetical protein